MAWLRMLSNPFRLEAIGVNMRKNRNYYREWNFEEGEEKTEMRTEGEQQHKENWKEAN